MVPDFLKPILVVTVIFVTFFLVYKEKIRVSIGLLLANLIFIITGILSAKDVLSGLSNESIVSIILLIIITAGLRKNFDIDGMLNFFFKGAKTYRSFLFRMMTQAALVSSIINNTPVVAIMTPYVSNWGKRYNISPSKLLIPLSFATIMGGMITLIGTSTTLVLNGFLMNLNLPIIHSFDLLMVGLSVTFTGIVFISFIGHKLLPDRKDALEKFTKNKREYLVETQLTKNSALINKTVLDGGLRNLNGVYLVEIIRDDKTISPVAPTEKILQHDLLIFAGDTDNILDLVNTRKDLELPTHTTEINKDSMNVIEAVVSRNSSLVGQKVKDTNFRNRYDGAIIAIHRNGERLSGKIGELRISAGDLLLLFAGKSFEDRVDLYRDIYVVSRLLEKNKPSKKEVYPFLILVATAVILLILGYFSLFTSLLIIFAVMSGLNMVKLQDIRRSIDLNMIAILVFSLSLGQAIIKSGAHDIISSYFVDVFQPYGLVAILTGLFLLTAILTSFITNVGAVSITFPIAYALSNQLGIEGAPFYLAIAYAASAAFLTPISYQTNLIVYGPGGYSFKDFFKVGLPVTLVYLLTCLCSIIVLYRTVLIN